MLSFTKGPKDIKCFSTSLLITNNHFWHNLNCTIQQQLLLTGTCIINTNSILIHAFTETQGKNYYTCSWQLTMISSHGDLVHLMVCGLRLVPGHCPNGLNSQPLMTAGLPWKTHYIFKAAKVKVMNSLLVFGSIIAEKQLVLTTTVGEKELSSSLCRLLEW